METKKTDQDLIQESQKLRYIWLEVLCTMEDLKKAIHEQEKIINEISYGKSKDTLEKTV